jgi:hypothetical protein
MKRSLSYVVDIREEGGDKGRLVPFTLLPIKSNGNASFSFQSNGKLGL